MSNLLKLFTRTVFIITISTFSISCLDRNSAHTEATLKCVELPIAISAVSHVAEVKGYIKDTGLNYFVQSVPSGPQIVSALQGGRPQSADCGSIAFTPISTLVAARDEPVILATLLESNHLVQLVVRLDKEADASAITLKGKKVGVVQGTIGEIYLTRLLGKDGLTISDITLVNGKPSDLKNLLLRGELDAAILWDPFISQVLKGGSDRLKAIVDPELVKLAFHLVTTKPKLEKLRPQFVKLLIALIKAGDFMSEHPKEARTLLREWLRLEDGDLDIMFDTSDFRVDLDVAATKKQLKETILWLKERRPDAYAPEEVNQYIDASLLHEIDPARVTR